MLATILRALRTEVGTPLQPLPLPHALSPPPHPPRPLALQVEKLLAERLARQHATGRNQAAFLINNYDLIVSLLAERGARGEDSLHFEQLLDSIKATLWRP